MRSIKRTYVLPPDLLEQFEEEVEPGRRSAVITELLRRWLDDRRRQRLRVWTRGQIFRCDRPRSVRYTRKHDAAIENRIPRSMVSRHEPWQQRPGRGLEFAC